MQHEGQPLPDLNVHAYDGSFFKWVDLSALRSAEKVVPIVHGIISPKSVLDVGCGRGAWLTVWRSQNGVERVLGVDGVSADQLRATPARDVIRNANLESGFSVGERFDLVQCLEVAEHLSPQAAPLLVKSLALHSDVILFSAARPGDGGEHHVNEQEPEYWRDLFEGHGLRLYDTVRSRIAGDAKIDPWYRYNTFIFTTPEIAARLNISGDAVMAPQRPKSYESALWCGQRMIVRHLPVKVVTRLAQLKARAMNTFSRR
jgi:SAM-dependent methyltransferase